MSMDCEAITKKRSTIVWTQEKDLLMLKEIASEGLLLHKSKSRERGTGWVTVANRLSPIFANVEVTGRGVRDHFMALVRKHKFKMGQEERASGIGGAPLTEVEELLEELINICEEAEKRMDDEARKQTAEKAQAQEMRQRAMERYGETRKRANEDEVTPERKRRKSNDTLDWLKEKMVMDKELKEKELDEKRKEREEQKDERTIMFRQMQESHAETTALLKHQMAQQQQQQEQHNQQLAMFQQQMFAMMQQQQQQTQILVNLLKHKD